MFLGEATRLRTFQVCDADHAIPVDQRHGQLRAGLRVHRDVARVLAGVRDQHGLAGSRCCPHNPLPETDTAFVGKALVLPQGEHRVEGLGLLVHEHDAEAVVIDQAFRVRANFAQQLVQHQHGAQLAADLIQELQGPRLTHAAPIEPRILDGHGDAARQEFQQVLVLLGKEIPPGRLQVQHADDPVFRDQGHRQFRLHRGQGLDVGGVLAHIVDQHRAARLRGPAHDALAHLDAQALHHLLGMAEAEAHPQLLLSLMQQEDGKHVVVDDALHYFGDAHHQLVQIESGVEALAELEQERQELGQLQGFRRRFEGLSHTSARPRPGLGAGGQRSPSGQRRFCLPSRLPSGARAF